MIRIFTGAKRQLTSAAMIAVVATTSAPAQQAKTESSATEFVITGQASANEQPLNAKRDASAIRHHHPQTLRQRY